MENTIELIAQELEARKQTIVPAENSIFSALDLSNSDQDMNAICGKLANVINAELILVKNKLVPFMQDISKLFQEAIDKSPNTSELAKYNIVTYSAPVFLDELAKARLIGTKRAPEALGNNTVIVPVPATEELRRFFKHPTASLDAYVAPILEKYKDEDLIALWDKYLANIGPTNINISNMGRETYATSNDLCLVYVALTNLRESKPVGVSSPDKTYFDMIEVYFKEVGNFLAIALDDLKIARNIGRVIYKIEDYTAYVDEVTYDMFIEELKQPDIILGLIASPEKREIARYLLPDIKTHAGEYLDTWSRMVKMDQQASLGRTVEKYKLIYNITFEKIYKQYIPFDLKEYVREDFTKILERYNNLIGSMSFSDILDVNLVAREIVAKVLFVDTNFEFFTDCMLNYAKLNPGLTPADTATFASVDFILKYILAQVDLTTANDIIRV